MEFTEPQRKTITSALTLLSVGVIVAFAVIALWGLIALLKFASGAITPLVIGLFLAMLFKPYYLWWLKTVKNPSLAVAVMILSVLLPIGVFLWFFGLFAINQLGGMLDSAPGYIATFKVWVNSEFPNAVALVNKLDLPYESWIASMKASGADIARSVVSYVTSILGVLVSLVFFLYFITKPSLKGSDLTDEMPFLKTDTKRFVSDQIDSFINIVISFARRQMIICILEGILYGVGFSIVGLKYGFVVGFALGLFNFVPFLGTVVFLPVALLVAYFGAEGSGSLALWVTGVWLTGQFLDGYFITPKIQGDKTGIGYAGVIFSFFFWGIVFNSILGLLLAIPLSAFCLVLWRAIKEKYIKPVL